MTRHPLADALNAVLDHSGARGTYNALKYADAVESAEKALAQYKKSDTDRDQLREALETLDRVIQFGLMPEGLYPDQADRALERVRAALASKTAIDPATVERDKLIEALTPSGYTKAAYSGDFKINVEIENVDFEEDEDESDHNPRTLMMPVMVDWTTIKDIMKAIRIRALGKDQ